MRDSIVGVDDRDERFTLWAKRINNSDDAPGFGRMYMFVATDPETHKGVIVYNDRFKTDRDAFDFMGELVKRQGDRIAARVEYVRENC